MTSGRIVRIILSIVLSVAPGAQAAPYCASLLLRTPETIRDFLTEGGLYADVAPILKIGDLNDSRWYQKNRRKILNDLDRPLESFNSRAQLEKALVRLTAHFYPISMARRMGLGRNSFSEVLSVNAQRSLLRGGILRFVEASELPAAQKAGWLRSLALLSRSTLITLLNPMRVTKFLEKDLTLEEAESVLYEGLDAAKLKYPGLARSNAFRIAAPHLRLYGTVALLAFSAISQSKEMQRTMEERQSAADARASSAIVEFDRTKTELGPENDAKFLDEIHEAGFQAYVRLFEERLQRKATPEEMTYFRGRFAEELARR
ncbi:MAG: hypothetical protein ABL958_02565 [Bdellovibrionia bacterium]